MATLQDIDKTRVPQHVAIIMDGNGRWAKSRGEERTFGHKAGVDALHEAIESANDAGVKYLTVYTFSTENWNRPQQEVDALMHLICWGIEREMPEMIRRGARLHVIGDMDRLPDFARERLQTCIDNTAAGTAIHIIVALSYSSRWEITKTVQELTRKAAAGEIRPDDITEETITAHLATREFPDPDLLIRTGGDCRISNYLLWQIAYSELYFCDTYWPDFHAADLYDAIVSYQSRERRFGKTSAQVQAEAAEAK